MKWLLGLVAAVVALAAVATAIPFFISLDDYVPRIEKEASARLKEPVTIRKLRLSVLPLPHVVVDGISVGKGGEVTVGSVSVTPDLLSLLSDTKVIRSIEVDSLVLTRKALAKIPVWARKDAAPAGPAAVRIGSVRVNDAVVKLAAATIGPFDARIGLDDSGAPVEVSLALRDGRLKALVRPDRANYLVTVTARGWKSPAGPPIVFDALDVEGVATAANATFNRVSAKLYGGTIDGKAEAAWQKGVQIKGALDVSQLELKNLVPVLAPGARVGGRLNAKPVFSATAKEADGLANALRLSTPFDIRNGVLGGVDLQKAATSLGKQGASSGETRFEQLSGHLALEQGAYRFTQLRIGSGMLSAAGSVGISARKELSGRINTQVKLLGASAAVPLDVSGTVQSPLVLPTRGTMAGAAIGTVLMPGVGTGVGAKAGQMIEGLFGRK